jgi:hypothetical protein
MASRLSRDAMISFPENEAFKTGFRFEAVTSAGRPAGFAWNGLKGRHLCPFGSAEF